MGSEAPSNTDQHQRRIRAGRALNRRAFGGWLLHRHSVIQGVLFARVESQKEVTTTWVEFKDPSGISGVVPGADRRR